MIRSCKARDMARALEARYRPRQRSKPAGFSVLSSCSESASPAEVHHDMQQFMPHVDAHKKRSAGSFSAFTSEFNAGEGETNSDERFGDDERTENQLLLNRLLAEAMQEVLLFHDDRQRSNPNAKKATLRQRWRRGRDALFKRERRKLWQYRQKTNLTGSTTLPDSCDMLPSEPCIKLDSNVTAETTGIDQNSAEGIHFSSPNRTESLAGEDPVEPTAVDLSEMYDEETLTFLNSIESFVDEISGNDDTNDTALNNETITMLSRAEEIPSIHLGTDDRSSYSTQKGEDGEDVQSLMQDHANNIGPPTVGTHHEIHDVINLDDDSKRFLAALTLLRECRSPDWADFDSIALEILEAGTLEEECTKDAVQDHNQVLRTLDSDEKVASGTLEDSQHDIYNTPLGKNTNLLDDLLFPDIQMPTSEANLVLLNLALSSDRTTDEILLSTMTLFQTMVKLRALGIESCSPDAYTYEIALLIIARRLFATRSGIDVVVADMMKSATYSPRSLLAAFELCGRNSDRKVAGTMLEQVINDETKTFRLPNRVYSAYLKLLISEEDMEKSLELLRTCLKENHRPKDKFVDEVFITALTWPKRNPASSSQFLRSIYDLMISDDLYHPGLPVLLGFVDACSQLKGFRQLDNVTALLRDVFHDILQRTHFTPNNKVLTLGLQTSEMIPDPLLARKLALCCIRNEREQNARTHAREISAFSDVINHATHDEDRIRTFSSPEVMKAVEICIKSGEMEQAQSIVGSVDELGDTVSSQFKSALHTFMLKGFAQRGDSAAALARLDMMRDSDMMTSDELYGAVLHAYARTSDCENALNVYEKMKRGDYNDSVLPGPSSCGALVLAFISNHEWRKGLDVYTDMKTSGIVPNAATIHGLLLGAFKHGGLQQASTFILELLDSDIVPSQATCTLALRLFIPVLNQCDSTTLMRQHLREMVDENGADRDEALDLLRSVRVAELEESRKPGGTLSQHALIKRKQDAWRSVLEKLIEGNWARDEDIIIE